MVLGVFAQRLERTTEGFEKDFGVNHMGHFVFFPQLKAALLASSTASFNSRVVMVASTGHRMGEIHFDDINFEHHEWDPVLAYA
jgi:NAD(P)-dependent dehydrogenase (short-subunit alcohol dehydrogenase family)